MFVRVVRELANTLTDGKKCREFMEMVELRQRLFREHKSTLLILDPYDLVCDHVLLYESEKGPLIAYLRSISLSACRRYDLEFPIAGLLKSQPQYTRAYQEFLKESLDPMHMGYLCADPAYKEMFRGIKSIDLMAWLGFMVSGRPPEVLGLSATLNNRYKQDPPMLQVGTWIPDLPDMEHPLVKDKHRVVLIPRVRTEYWGEQREKFKATYQTLMSEEGDFLRDESAIAA